MFINLMRIASSRCCYFKGFKLGAAHAKTAQSVKCRRCVAEHPNSDHVCSGKVQVHLFTQCHIDLFVLLLCGGFGHCYTRLLLWPPLIGYKTC